MDNLSPNPLAVEKIWLLFSVRLKAFILSKVKDDALADDLLQEVFIKIHRLSGQLRDENKLQAWIYQIARNTVYDYFRKPGQKSELPVIQPEAVEEETDNEYLAETVEDMLKKMDELPPEFCEALCLTELRGMSHKVYAEKAGISLSAAKTRAYRARNMLKDMLLKCCHYQFDRYGTVVDILPAGSCCCCDDSCSKADH